MKKYAIPLAFLVLALAVGGLFVVSSNGESSIPVQEIEGDPAQVPAPGMVTMVELGARECIPCRMMAPIVEELTEEYQGRVAVVFIDVWVDPDAAQGFDLRAIPTQIIYDDRGVERFRHEGFLAKEDIVAVFTQLGVR